jgi:hypothetical protein
VIDIVLNGKEFTSIKLIRKVIYEFEKTVDCNMNKQNINNCCECKEGCFFGKNVYCSIDGHFHPMYDNLSCKSFIHRNNSGMMYEHNLNEKKEKVTKKGGKSTL